MPKIRQLPESGDELTGGLAPDVFVAKSRVENGAADSQIVADVRNAGHPLRIGVNLRICGNLTRNDAAAAVLKSWTRAHLNPIGCLQ